MGKAMTQLSDGPAHWSETRIGRVISPMQTFIAKEQSSGIILLVMTALALLIANSPFNDGYQQILETKIGISVGTFTLSESVLHWINDGLMVIFFFVVGLEIKREFVAGELANPRAAALPILAAIGGAVTPAIMYALFNNGLPSLRGWGVPMATDIAFALGCLALLGDRVPFSLKVFLTAVAIVDDMLAVLVIALFYTAELHFPFLLAGLALLALLFGLNRLGVRSPMVYGLVGIVVWVCFLESGVHATIAGVLLALTVPARVRIDAPTFLERVRGLLTDFESADEIRSPILADERQQNAVHEIEDLTEHVQAPLQRLEHSLHGAVALVIMPIFALANAGVQISMEGLPSEAPTILGGVALGLLLGKPIGLVGITWLTVRLGIAPMLVGATWWHVLGVGVLAGIGFTMSLFIASLAFVGNGYLAVTKIAVLGTSLLAGALGMFILSRLPAQSIPSAPDE
jgi:NhaA family Na+:H+ antiporter